jgi:crotonobetainyl-CoA:carnitine CoA-transferase CaiB-like acyl-CoA transferase
MSHLPLSGIKVIDLSQYMTGPFAAMMLGDQGAEIIKVEPLGIGDPLRWVGTQVEGVGAMFANTNRGKRSIAIDLKKSRGVELVRRLVDSADVVLHNWRPGVAERLGLASDELRQRNPRLIYASITAFGLDGPLRDAPGFDHIVQAISGITTVQGSADDPALIRMAICDKLMAFIACQGVTSALLARERSGVGQHVDMSMLDTCLYFLWPDVMANSTFQDPSVVPSPSISGSFIPIPTKDGHFTMVWGRDNEFDVVLELAGRQDLAEDPRYATFQERCVNFETLYAEITTAFLDMRTADVLEYLQAKDVPCAECGTVEAILAHPQVSINRSVQRQDHPVLGPLNQVAFPVRFGGQPLELASPCPLYSEHAREILLENGIFDEEINRLVEEKVIDIVARSMSDQRAG